MEYRNLGKSGVKVSTLCLGTMTFGEADEKSFMHKVGCDEQTSFDIMNQALDGGINFFDTADVYGQDGLTERVIGNWFEKDGRRDEVVLATKCRFTMPFGPKANHSGASRLRIRQAVDDSLRRLKTDRIDLYQIHMQDIETPEEETLRALDDLVRAGKVLYIGASNYAAYRLVESLCASESRHLERFVTLQAQYSLVKRNIELEHIPACKRFGLGVLPWSPLAGGFLSGKYDKDAPPPEGARLTRWNERLREYGSEQNWAVIGEVKKVAAELDATPSEVSLAWLLTRPTVCSVIFGARSPEQLSDNLKAAALDLPHEHIRRLDEVSRPRLDYPYNFMENIQKRW